MDLIKKNLVSIICGAVALIAFIAYFWPLGGWVSQLENDTRTRAGVYSQLEQLRTKSRHLPNISVETTEAEPLTQFPSNAIIEEGKKATGQVGLESKQMQEMAVKLNQHQLMLPLSLPYPDDTTKFKFRDVYDEYMKKTIPVDILNSCSPPGLLEIDRVADELWSSKEFRDRIVMIDGKPDEGNLATVVADFQDRVSKLPTELRERAAREHKVFLSPGALTIHQGIMGVAAAPNPNDIWTAQLKTWVQEDVAKAIAAANADSQQGVLDAPIKHVISIVVPDSFIGAPAAPAAPRPGDEEGAATVPQNGPIPKNIGISPTGRVSNHLYDVMHFTMEMNVDAHRVPYVLEKLCQNQFMTVYDCDVTAVDSAVWGVQGYIYGNGQVVNLKLKCESLFMRDATKQFMPDGVKRRLGIPLQDPNQPPQAAAQ